MVRLTAERLDAALAGQVLTAAELRWPSIAGADLAGTRVLGTTTYGKHLLTRFDDGRTLHSHLRMDGQWRVERSGARRAGARHHAIRAVLRAERWTCVGWRLGMLDLLATRDEPRLLARLGPDVLADDFAPGTAESSSAPAPAGSAPAASAAGGPPPAGGARGVDQAVTRLGLDPARPLCEVLLDQGVVAGIGTIWMAESLFACRIHPWTPAGDLGVPEATRLLLRARDLMVRSVRVARSRGLGALELAVHGRARRPCRRCRTPIAIGTAGTAPYERPVFWCPTCQAPT